MSESSWGDRELPLLKAILSAETTGGACDVDSLCLETGLERSRVQASLKRLYDSGHIDGAVQMMLGTGFEMSQIRLREKGLQAVEEWPPEVTFEQFVGALQEAIDRENDRGRRAALQRALDAVRQVGVVGLGAVLASYMRRLLGF